MMFAFDSDKDFICVKGVAIASVLSFQAACINGSGLEGRDSLGGSAGSARRSAVSAVVIEDLKC